MTDAHETDDEMDPRKQIYDDLARRLEDVDVPGLEETDDLEDELESQRLLRAMADAADDPVARDQARQQLEAHQRRCVQKFEALTADGEDAPWPAPELVFPDDRDRAKRLAATGVIRADSKTKTMVFPDGSVWWEGRRPRHPAEGPEEGLGG